MESVIQVEELSKAYQLGQIGTGTLSRDIERWWAKTRGKEDPFLKIGEENDRTVKGNSDVVWSLRDVNFNVERGEALGIIGRNGAGKSTLLKILSQITLPTKGSVKIKGRIASLLEVGTGFHPELTGKENIFLNGAILGMRKNEIQKKFDAIVDFAGVERFIDTPVKRYSSGMYIRLAFAVAAHLESEILVIDEVLAVGDSEFQKKCLGKMSEVSKGEGRTVLFVSHNLTSIQALCSSTLLLDKGQKIFYGDTITAIQKYESLGISTSKAFEWTLDHAPQDNIMALLNVEILNGNEQNTTILYREDKLRVRIKYQVLTACKGIFASIHINMNGQCIFVSGAKPQFHETGSYEVICDIPELLFSNLNYTLTVYLVHNNNATSVCIENLISFFISEKLDFSTNVMGVIRPELTWSEPKSIL